MRLLRALGDDDDEPEFYEARRLAVAVTLGDVLLSTALPYIAVLMAGGNGHSAWKAARNGFILGVAATPAMFTLAMHGRTRPARRRRPPGDE